MKIAFSREKIMNLFLKAKQKLLSIGIIVFTLVLTLIINGIQTQKIGSLSAKKDAELKKNEVLKDITRSEKAIKLYKDLFSKRDASLIMNTISNIAKDSNIKLSSIKPGKEQSYPLYTRYPFILVIGADNYHAIGKFVSRIENQPEVYYVDVISIKSQEESQAQNKELAQEPGQENKIIVNLTLSIIAFKD